MNPTQNTLGTTGLPVAEMLRAAADYIDIFGWTQGQLYDATRVIDENAQPPACAIGAIQSVTRWLLGPLPTPTPSLIQAVCLEGAAVHALADHLSPTLDDEASQDYLLMLIERWNDNPNRTKDDVTTVLRTAAANRAGDVR